jgi:hypothetical protein
LPGASERLTIEAAFFNVVVKQISHAARVLYYCIFARLLKLFQLFMEYFSLFYLHCKILCKDFLSEQVLILKRKAFYLSRNARLVQDIASVVWPARRKRNFN